MNEQKVDVANVSRQNEAPRCRLTRCGMGAGGGSETARRKSGVGVGERNRIGRPHNYGVSNSQLRPGVSLIMLLTTSREVTAEREVNSVPRGVNRIAWFHVCARRG